MDTDRSFGVISRNANTKQPYVFFVSEPKSGGTRSASGLPNGIAGVWLFGGVFVDNANICALYGFYRLKGGFEACLSS